MPHDLVYPRLQQNKVNRYDKRATYDLSTIHNIINNSLVLHVSFAPSPDDPFPAILPMIGVMGSFEHPSAGSDEPLDCYLHGYVSSRLMRLAASSSFSVEESTEREGAPDPGLPVCIAGTKVDGLVLSLTPNSHSYNYRSAVLQGYATSVTDTAEKVWAMEQITEKVVRGRWSKTRVPPDKVEMDSTKILRVRIVSGSGKRREGGPHDDRKDTERSEVTREVWTGTVPVWETFGEPIVGGDGAANVVPPYLAEYLSTINERNEKYAVNAGKE
ncbi:MAG: hypothetical protein M1833_003736 [Piccolia ochrophora]|nr:MAG: hypothetical protein M1833_003736 [Piccolia ochrophora]